MRARKPSLVNLAPQSGHISPLPWTLEVDAYGTNIIAADGTRVAYVHSCSCNHEADADAELLVSAPALKMKVGVLEEERRSLLGNLEDQTNATAAHKRRADELLERLISRGCDDYPNEQAGGPGGCSIETPHNICATCALVKKTRGA